MTITPLTIAQQCIIKPELEEMELSKVVNLNGMVIALIDESGEFMRVKHIPKPAGIQMQKLLKSFDLF